MAGNLMDGFQGEPTRALESRFLRLEFMLRSPRIVRLAPAGQSNLFADLGNTPTRTPYGDFYFRGGHRLWHAPEAMPRTYVPDDQGATVEEIPGGVRIAQPGDPWTHIAKSIEIRLEDGRPGVGLRQELRNDGAWTVELAPWSVTMLRLGGVGIFPQPAGGGDADGLLPNRHMAFWPYARLDDPRLILRDDFVLVRAEPCLPPLKFGYLDSDGWIGYWIDGVLFVKRFAPEAGARFPDGGCNAECYCGDHFFELESLGPLASLKPGESVYHNETWEVYTSQATPLIPDKIWEIIDSLLKRPASRTLESS